VRRSYAYGWLTLCVAIWGSNFVIGKILTAYFSPSNLTMLRLLFIVLTLLVVALATRQFERLTWKDFKLLIPLGLIGVFLNQWSFFMGLKDADSTVAALILAVAPIVTAVLAAVFLGEKWKVRSIIGSIIAILGIYFVIGGAGSMLHMSPGLGWIFVTMLTFAIMIVMTRRLANRLPPLLTTLYSNLIGFIISIPVALIADRPIAIGSSFGIWGLLILSAVTVHGICNWLWNVHIRHVDASRASMLSNLEPFIAMWMGVMLLHKPVTRAQILGAVLIVCGVLLATVQRRGVFGKMRERDKS